MTESVDRLQITAPDDWHIHLRDKDALALTVAHASQSFERAIVMPNLVPPVTNAQQAMAYKERILSAVPEGQNFKPLMVLYLTDRTTAADIAEAAANGVVACKLYPAGATTNSDSGVTNIENIYPAIEALQSHDMKLLIHGEVTDAHVDIFDREAEFIARTMQPLSERFPRLKIVFEHITTQDAADFVAESGPNMAATITAHHLLYNRNHMLAGGIRPHYYCLPILKANRHQDALIKAATSGSKKFFLGTDSAPHTVSNKETSCGCAGAYTAYQAITLYAEAFEQAGALDQLEAFASFNGPDFYDLPRNENSITLAKQDWQMPDSFDYMGERLRPLLAGETISWKVVA